MSNPAPSKHRNTTQKSSKKASAPKRKKAHGAPEIQAATIPSQDMRLILLSSVAGGLTALLPVPFVDDMLIRRIHRRMNRELLEAHGVQVPTKKSRLLSETESSFFGGLFSRMVMFPVKRILKKVLFVFSIKGAADVSAAIFHDGWLLSRGLTQGYIDTHRLGQAEEAYMRQIRAAQMQTYREIDTKPLSLLLGKAYEGAQDLVMNAIGTLKSMTQDAETRQEMAQQAAFEADVAQVADRIDPERDLDQSYMRSLEHTFKGHLSPELRA